MKAVQYEHIPVLVNEVIHGLNIQPDGIYVDCTFGRGGHSKAILEKLGKKGRLLVFDRDPQAIEVAHRLSADDPRVRVIHAKFSEISRFLGKEELLDKISGILFDLGVSSPQIEDPGRGFSFLLPGPLDMRMDPTSGISAKDWINQSDESEIVNILRNYGEERFARRIARSIVKHRNGAPITTTTELADIIAGSVPTKEKNKHPATRTFQAIRILINNELDELQAGLMQAFNALAIQGRLAVISFHSLEDRVIKRFMRKYSINDPYPEDLPVLSSQIKPSLKIISRLIKPDEIEHKENIRSRSAKLRISERLRS